MFYTLCMMADFQSDLIFRVFSVFWSVFLQRTTVNDLQKNDMFFLILIFHPKWGLCMGCGLWIMADFQNGLISRIFSVFCRGFLQRTSVDDL